MLTEVPIPDYVIVVAGFGPKFNYFTKLSDIPADDVFVCLQRIKDNLTSYEELYDFNHFEANDNASCSHDFSSSQPTYAQTYIENLLNKTKRFLIKNPDIIITLADKGGKVVILDKQMYMRKMNGFVDENIQNRVYRRVSAESTRIVTTNMENKFDEIRRELNPFLIIDKDADRPFWIHPLRFEPYVFSYLYGCVKIHKESLPMRPIISATNCQGSTLAHWLRNHLNSIANNLSKNKIKNSFDLFEKLKNVQFDVDDKLTTHDYDSMFTNIPYAKVESIIQKYYYLIGEDTSVPIELFLKALSFLVEESSYFIFDDDIFRQSKGLTMGNSLSQVLAEIYTSETMNVTAARFDNGKLKFMGKFVDDIISICKKDDCTMLDYYLTKDSDGLTLKVTNEDENREVSYLDSKVGFNEHNRIYMKWYQKPCSKNRILDHHSFHPHEMKTNVVNEFINAALKITSPPYLYETIGRLKTTLSNSNYSKKFILKSIFNAKKNVDPTVSSNVNGSCTMSTDDNPGSDQPRESRYSVSIAERTGLAKSCSSRFRSNKHFRYASYREKRTLLSEETPTFRDSPTVPRARNAYHKYVAYPYCPSLRSSLTTRLKRCATPNIRLAPTPVRQNRKYVFSTTKCKRLMTDMVNSSFSLSCTKCNLRLYLKTDSKDIARTISHHMSNNESPVFKHIHSHPNHNFGEPGDVRQFKDKKELDWLFPYSVSEKC